MQRNKCIVMVLVLAIVLVTGVLPVAANKIADVPTDHWAYQAVATLVNKGYLAVYEDGTYQGNQSVDRYTLAVTLARMLDEIEAGRVTGSMEDINLLNELTNEFREELVKWYSDREAVEKKLSDTQTAGRVIEERVSRVVAAQVELQEELQGKLQIEVAKIREELIAEAKRTNEEFAKQQALLENQGRVISLQKDTLDNQDLKLNEHAAKLASQTGLLDSHQQDLAGLESALINLESQLISQKASLDQLANWAGEKGAVFATLETEDADLRQSTAAMATNIEALQAQIVELQAQLGSLGEDKTSEIAEVNKKIEELTSQVARADGQLLKTLEQNRLGVDELVARNKEMETDLQNLAVRIQREGQSRADQSASYDQKLAALASDLAELETQIGISEEVIDELTRLITDEISIQMNAALIREQRLERQLKELDEEFDSFKNTVEQQNKSIKGSATLAMVVAAVGILVGFIK